MSRLPSLAGCLLFFALALLPPAARLGLAQPCGGSGSLAMPCCLNPTLPLGVVPPGGTFALGCGNEYVLLSAHGSGRKSTSDLLDLPPCPVGPCGSSRGADAIRCWTINDYPCCTDSMGIVGVASGNKSGPFLQALETRWGMDTDQRSGTCFADYHGNGVRLVHVWVVAESRPPERATVILLRRARFFLKSLPLGPQGDLIGEFLGYASGS